MSYTRSSGSGPVRLAEVANAVGVSVATASRALNGAAGVSATHRAQIVQVAEQLGYARDPAGHSLRSGKTYLVGVWVESISNASSGRLVSALTDTLHPHGYDVLVTEYSHDRAEDASRIRALARRRPDFMVVLHPRQEEPWSNLVAEGHQVVLISSGPAEGWQGALVHVDGTRSRLDMASHLVGLGHHRLLVLAPAARIGRPGSNVLPGVIKAHGLPLDVNVLPLAGQARGEEGATLDQVIGLLRAEGAPTCVQVNEASAASLLTALRRAGFRIPADVSVLTAGSPPWAELVDPPLARTEVDYYQCGLAAAELVLHIRDGGPPEVRTVHGRYVQRPSVGVAPSTVSQTFA